MDHSVVEYRLEGQAAVVTLNRPDRRNAIDAGTSRVLADLRRRWEGDSDVRAVVLTGEGEVFCAGADLQAVAGGGLPEILATDGHFAGLVRARRRKPLIAAVNGPALAGGFEIVLACDIAVAEEQAVFGLPEVRVGLVAAAGGVVRLPRAIGVKRAMELALTGDTMNATDALAAGLVSRVVPAGEALATALGIASRIADNSPLAVRETRAVVADACDPQELEGVWRRNDEALERVLASPDSREGPRAFLERRNPGWE